MRINEAGKNLIKAWEGYRGVAYRCSGNKWTLGWGHTSGVMEGQSCTHDQAEAWFSEDVRWAQDAVNTHISDRLTARLAPRGLSENEFSALASWTFNVGTEAMKNSTLARRLVYDDDFECVPDQLRRWRYAGGRVIQGLINRREAEIELWRKADDSSATTISDADLAKLELVATADDLDSLSDRLRGLVDRIL